MKDLPQLPDSHFLPAMELNVVEKDVAAKIKEHYNNKRTLIIGRTAHVTGPLGHSPQRTNCQYRDMCWNGCPFGGIFQYTIIYTTCCNGNRQSYSCELILL